MLPDIFRELDQVAAREFAFLVDQEGSQPPTVEYWRDYFLVYLISDDVRVRVGMERGTTVPFLFLDYQKERFVTFYWPRLLSAMGLTMHSSEFRNCLRLAESFSISEYWRLKKELQSEWPKYLKECARVLQENFRDIVARVRSASQEGEAQGIGTVVPEGVAVIGAGSHFIHKSILPIEREDFWRLIDQDSAPTYAQVRCSFCGESGNMGVRKPKPTSFRGWFRKRRVELLCLKCGRTLSGYK